MSKVKEVPVFLFTGFLESGKTKFIQETLEDKRFNSGERTLLIVCEEGEEEYAPDKFSAPNVFMVNVEEQAELTRANLRKWLDEHDCERCVIEYNGMWMLDDLYQALPEMWMVYQEFFFADARSILSYNANMRNLVYDKISSCELVIFNRCKKDVDKDALHKLVRAISRKTDIAYEYTDGTAEYDDIVDPLPFDLNADVIEIADRDYALWYRDTTEDMNKYDGKTVSFTALVAIGKEFPADTFVGGRKLMTCCANDVMFAGFVCKTEHRDTLKNGDWVKVTGKIEIRFNALYGRKGPVIHAEKIEKTAAPEEPVATFY